MVEHGYGVPEDLAQCEESGTIDGAEPSSVSDRAKTRGLPQVGTLGSGNHFLEVQYVERIFAPEAAPMGQQSRREWQPERRQHDVPDTAAQFAAAAVATLPIAVLDHATHPGQISVSAVSATSELL